MSNTGHRIIVTGGGTGGHLYPAIAVMALLKQEPSVESLLYIGNKNKAESVLVPEMGVRFYGIQFEGLKKSWRILIWPFLLLLTTLKLFLVFRLFKPTVVFATGGYVIAPVLLTALLMRIPYVIHEPDAHAGKANRVFAFGAKQITCGFAGALKTFGQKAICTGNPIRNTFGKIDKTAAVENLKLDGWDITKKSILVIGGSQGALKINEAILATHLQLAEKYAIQILHQTGDKLFDEALAHFDNNTPPGYYHIKPFITDMASAYAVADIIISRAGAMSLAEIFMGGLPAILIPYPYATADHQRKNAESAVNAGAAQMILDKALTGEVLMSVLEPLLNDPARQLSMRQSALQLAKPNATQDVVQIILTQSTIY